MYTIIPVSKVSLAMESLLFPRMSREGSISRAGKELRAKSTGY